MHDMDLCLSRVRLKPVHRECFSTCGPSGRPSNCEEVTAGAKWFQKRSSLFVEIPRIVAPVLRPRQTQFSPFFVLYTENDANPMYCAKAKRAALWQDFAVAGVVRTARACLGSRQAQYGEMKSYVLGAAAFLLVGYLFPAPFAGRWGWLV
jgi:hypothetical protein